MPTTKPPMPAAGQRRRMDPEAGETATCDQTTGFAPVMRCTEAAVWLEAALVSWGDTTDATLYRRRCGWHTNTRLPYAGEPVWQSTPPRGRDRLPKHVCSWECSDPRTEEGHAAPYRWDVTA